MRTWRAFTTYVRTFVTGEFSCLRAVFRARSYLRTCPAWVRNAPQLVAVLQQMLAACMHVQRAHALPDSCLSCAACRICAKRSDGISAAVVNDAIRFSAVQVQEPDVRRARALEWRGQAFLRVQGDHAEMMDHTALHNKECEDKLSATTKTMNTAVQQGLLPSREVTSAVVKNFTPSVEPAEAAQRL